ncbi:GH92 family glycosyl hydrolase [Jejudonia soesokkakensis]|uniref:GH92 family glycosyl hydrolase n=1 Tax=Jejudonia soesokkakensis TaxID=1323432 RepID=A0ABW2MSK9_9FLAO
MKKVVLAVLCVLFFINCSEEKGKTTISSQQQKSLTAYVNPFIGTGGHGHTYPGATMPFGMMQLSPDTRLDGWDGCSGYHYSDNYIYGFSHTHLSGTGVSDYGDILLMPTNEINFHNGADGKKGYRAHFSHDNEKASPGYYKVLLDSTNIDVELTVTPRAGMHQYIFSSPENQYTMLDLLHRDKVLDAKIEVVSNTELQGYRFSKAWASDQRVFFNLKTSHPFTHTFQTSSIESDDDGRKIALQFLNPKNEPVYISIGISAVDMEGAKKNRETEIGTKTFQQIKTEATEIWEKQLQKIVIEDSNEEHLYNFYTALYHTMIAPNLYQDVDGRYRGMDMKIHQTTDFDYYTVFSLWDTFRAAHPLYTIIEEKRTSDFVNTMLAKYEEGGILPIWDLSASYTGCMIGYHGVPVIADAYLKGIEGFNAEKAFEAVKHSAMQDKLGLKSYKENGFIPVEEESESVSKTLEYAYDDWTIAMMAKRMGKEHEYALFSERAQNYKNVYNPKTGFMQGRFNNTWFGPFDPYEVNFNYTEANAWQYSLFVPQDISGLIEIMGGKDKFETHLDNLFTAKAETSGRNQADITGLIGQYAHGNEPSHHMAYLYNFVNKPYKTQELTRQILTELYKNKPDGISGNEDCGQMSAWYIFSSLGFYPVTPGTNQYIIGAPLFKKATLNLESGNTFTVVAEGLSEANKYIKSATLNGMDLKRSYLTHEEIMQGGMLVFTMTNAPSDWATQDQNIPKTSIEDNAIILAPFLASGDIAFKENTEIALEVASKDSEIFYCLDEGNFQKYTSPFKISKTTTLKTYAQKGSKKSQVLTTNFFKIDKDLSVSLETVYSNEYNAGGPDALIDGIKGTRDFRTGAWQGYWGKDLIATVDRSKPKLAKSVTINFLEDQGSWIFFPTKVQVYVAGADKKFRLSRERNINATLKNDTPNITKVVFSINKPNIQYIKIVATNLGKLPEWHLGYPNGDAWIFVDEIEIK